MSRTSHAILGLALVLPILALLSGCSTSSLGGAPGDEEGKQARAIGRAESADAKSDAVQMLEAKRIENFTLPDMHGHDRSLDEFAKSRAIVVAFLGTECPLARLYGPRLQELSQQYAAKGVAFVAIDANNQDSLSEMVQYTRDYGVKFPFLKDRDGSLADQFGAVRNPEVFLLDSNRTLRYRGRVDDQYGLGSSSGYARPELKDRSLGKALDEVLAGKQVSQPLTQVTGCIIGRTAKVEPKGEITYTKHIATIIEDRCLVCHREGQVGPFALTDYESVSSWGAMIKEVVSEGRMPPWSASPEFGHFSNDPRLSDDERSRLFTWINNGCPQGNPADLPPARKWAEGWHISEPDEVFAMTRPFHIPAEGVLNYQNFSVDTGWTEDKWIQQAECQPGAWANVHHIVLNISSGRGRGWGPEGLDAAALRGGRLGGYNPGRNPTIYPPGTAFFAPRGSRITFQMHYTTNGKAADDISRIGIVYADPKTIKYAANMSRASSQNFAIPPHADNYKVVAETSFWQDTSVIVLHPHMHLRGKAMKYEVFYPDGASEILLDVDHFDFNWQLDYLLAEPKPMPAGTRMRVTAHYDNSENNVANPDPNGWIGWGSQTWDEMMIGYFTTITPVDGAALEAASKRGYSEPSFGRDFR